MPSTIARACTAALQQASSLWPKRRRSSDGTIGDQAHRARRSWHNPSKPDGTPDPDGVVYAFDLSHDPANGCDAHALVRAAVARRDRRVLQAISDRRIWTKARAAEGWRPYSGQNPHTKHAHVTVDPRFADDTSPWWVLPKPKTPAAIVRRIVKRYRYRLPAAGVLERGSRGDAVRAVQERLGLTERKVGAGFGTFGPRTEAAVIAFQKSKKLRPDGVVGPITLRALARL